MTRMLAVAMLLCAVAALADETTPKAAPEPAKIRPPLKLRLDDAPPVAPRITFSPREDAQKAPADTLPALGGPTSPAFVQRPPPGAKGSPFPPDTNPTQ